MSCVDHCPLPYEKETTVQDLFTKLEAADNTSFYGSHSGKNDIVLNVIFSEDFTANLVKHLSSTTERPRLDSPTREQQLLEMKEHELTI